MIKQFFQNKKRIKGLEEANAFLVKKFQEVTDKAIPELVIEKAMGRGVKWFDHENQSMESQVTYFGDAQLILNNKTFVNEVNHLIADSVNYIARESETFEDVNRARRTIVALELLKGRLEQINDPRKDKPSTNDLNSAI